MLWSLFKWVEKTFGAILVYFPKHTERSKKLISEHRYLDSAKNIQVSLFSFCKNLHICIVLRYTYVRISLQITELHKYMNTSIISKSSWDWGLILLSSIWISSFLSRQPNKKHISIIRQKNIRTDQTEVSNIWGYFKWCNNWHFLWIIKLTVTKLFMLYFLLGFQMLKDLYSLLSYAFCTSLQTLYQNTKKKKYCHFGGGGGRTHQ